MHISVLGSGSNGNCTLISTGRTSLLVDNGFGPRSLARRLKQAGLHHLKVDAVLVTHGHSDHVCGIPAFLKHFDAVVYMNSGTRLEVPHLSALDRWECFYSGLPFEVGDITVEAFDISHDAADPVGFRFTCEGITGALATDLGELNSRVLSKLKRCDWLILESNHDEELLKIGPYPWHLKQRVLSRAGHLSNAAMGKFLSQDFDGSASHLFLAHLSRENNDPEIALESARQALSKRRRGLFDLWQIHLTHQNKPSIVLNL